MILQEQRKRGNYLNDKDINMLLILFNISKSSSIPYEIEES
jgi:hypothetical protein